MKKFLFLGLVAIAVTAVARPVEVAVGSVSNGGQMGGEVTVKTVVNGHAVGGIAGEVGDRQYAGVQYTSPELGGFARVGLGLAQTQASWSKQIRAAPSCNVCGRPAPIQTTGSSSNISPFVSLEAFHKLKSGIEVFGQTRYFTEFSQGENGSQGRFFTGVGVRFLFD